MRPVSQILERNIALFSAGSWLIINPEESAWVNICTASDFTVLHQYINIFQQCTGFSSALEFDSRDVIANSGKLSYTLKKGRHTHIFAPFLESGQFDNVLINMPKSKSHFKLLVDIAQACLANDGNVYVVGENKSGIKSIAKILETTGRVSKEDSARHCTLLHYKPNKCRVEFSPERYLQTHTYSVNNHEWFCCNYPGVFSEGRLDEGTQLLLQSLPQAIIDKTLDFACGAGVVAAYVMTNTPNTPIDCLDVSALALYASAQTLHSNGLHAKLIGADGLMGVNGRYRHILSNPPFHTGVHTDYEVTTRFINKAKSLLLKNGRMTIVANKFLPYLAQLQRNFKQVDIVKQNTRFTVYACHE
jgi:16S rRNA (guanine1207-N2)-methyltransferase